MSDRMDDEEKEGRREDDGLLKIRMNEGKGREKKREARLVVE